MLSDVAALVPPFLVAAAFLAAVWAFLRHEMARAKNSNEEDDVEVFTQTSAGQPEANPGQRSDDGGSAGDHRR